MEVNLMAGSLLCIRDWIQSFLRIHCILSLTALSLDASLTLLLLRFDTLIIIAALVATVANTTIQSGQCHQLSASPPPGSMCSISKLCRTSVVYH